MALDFPPHQEIELLVRAAQLNVGLQHDRVVRLRQGIEQLVHGDRLFFLETLMEVVALQHLRDRVLGRQANPVLRFHLAQPLAVEAHLGFVEIEDLVHLGHVGLGIAPDLLCAERGACDGSPCWVADHAREVADDEDHRVTHVLEMFQLAQQNGVAKVQVRSGGIETRLHP